MILKSIKYKIWLIFLITLTLCMIGMLMLTQISMRSGFIHYVASQTVHKLAYIDDSLIAIYQKEGSLDKLKNNTQEWTLLRKLAFKNIQFDSMDAEASSNQHQIEFVNQLVLLDTEKNSIVGNVQAAVNYNYHEVRFKDKVIALIAFTKPIDFFYTIDHQFFRQQMGSLAQISFAVALISLIFVLILSRGLIRPLTALSKSAQQLTSGDFSVRIDHESSDELGILCKNFNELANTLASNEKARKQWVADISHEMRTPLAVVKAQIEAMQDGIRPTDKENLSLLKDKIDALSHLINDLYELSLSDLGALTYSKSRLDITQLVHNTVNDFAVRADKKNISLKLNLHPTKPVHVFGDANRLTQLLANVLENALRYTDAPGKVLVELRCEKKTAELFVIDSAPAVPNDKLESIFDRLTRMETSRNRDTGGAGLGLSICKNIVEAHNGHISAHPSPLGGLQIRIALPVHLK